MSWDLSLWKHRGEEEPASQWLTAWALDSERPEGPYRLWHLLARQQWAGHVTSSILSFLIFNLPLHRVTVRLKLNETAPAAIGSWWTCGHLFNALAQNFGLLSLEDTPGWACRSMWGWPRIKTGSGDGSAFPFFLLLAQDLLWFSSLCIIS
jgi:hypothetical protein